MSSGPLILVADDRVDNVEVLQHFRDTHGLFHALSPGSSFHRAQHQVIVTNRRRIVLGKYLSQKRFNFVLMSDQQVTIGAIAAGLVEHYRIRRIDDFGANNRARVEQPGWTNTIYISYQSQLNRDEAPGP